MSPLTTFFGDTWDGNSPGTLAVVIGVSRYPSLAELAERDPEQTYGLSELSVSSLTAYRFATWLRDTYRSTGSPLVRCWLLASPTEDEIEEEPGLKGLAEPTFRNCEDAIWEWYSAASQVPPEQAQQSRLVFFFSGHGLERTMDEQLLLPSDYLERGLVNRAINVKDVRQGLAACGIPEQLFLIDACRSDHRRLRDLGFALTGTQVLNPVGSSRAYANLDSPVLYGASSGQSAFAPDAVHLGLTLFGQALLSGLSEPPEASIERRADQCVVVADRLLRYMNARVAELLVSYQSDAEQKVRMGGQSSGEFVVSEVSCSAAVAAEPPSVRTSEARRTESVALTDASTGALIGASQGVDPFGDPVMAELWTRGTLAVPGEADAQPPQLTLVRVDRRGTSIYDVVIRLDGEPFPSDLWLPADTGEAGPGFLCQLPYVGPGALFSLHVVRDESGSIGYLEANLDPQNTGLLGVTAEAWRTYREQSAAAACALLPDDALASVVRGETLSPLPAVVGYLHRVLAGRPVDLASLERLMVVHEDWSDPAVLRAESLRRQADPAFDVGQIGDLDPPRTTGVRALAWHLLVPGGVVDGRNDPYATALARELARTISRTQPGSLFPVTFGAAGATASGLVP